MKLLPIRVDEDTESPYLASPNDDDGKWYIKWYLSSTHIMSVRRLLHGDCLPPAARVACTLAITKHAPQGVPFFCAQVVKVSCRDADDAPILYEVRLWYNDEGSAIPSNTCASALRYMLDAADVLGAEFYVSISKEDT